jgi:hypothetical protein
MDHLLLTISLGRSASDHSEWLQGKAVQKLVVVIHSVESKDVLERWQFDVKLENANIDNKENSYDFLPFFFFSLFSLFALYEKKSRDSNVHNRNPTPSLTERPWRKERACPKAKRRFIRRLRPSSVK